MKNIIKYIFTLAYVFLFLGCSISTKNFPQPEKLKIAISKSIDIPFSDSQIVIYDSFNGICGNSSDEELNRYYEPNLIESPYRKIITNNYKGKVLFKGIELNKSMDSFCDGIQESKWKCFSKDKVVLSISGKALSNESVEIYERYFLNKKVHSINKVFDFIDGEWIYKVTEMKFSK